MEGFVVNAQPNGFVKVATKDQLRTGCSLSVRVEGVEVAIFQIGKDIIAVENNCPHQHFQMLHQGSLNQYALTCPMHGWTFDLKTGRAIIGSGRLRQYAVRLEGDEVWIEKPKEEEFGSKGANS